MHGGRLKLGRVVSSGTLRDMDVEDERHMDVTSESRN